MTTAWVRSRSPSLLSTRLTCVFTVSSVTTRRAAGIIIKESTQPGSAYAAMIVTADHGVRMQDDYTNDTAGQPGAASAASPRWLRLTRSGDTITGYDSADGTQWTQVGTVHLAASPRRGRVLAAKAVVIGSVTFLAGLAAAAAAVTIVIVAIVLPYLLGVASVLPVSASDWLLRITPAAAFAVQQAAPQYPQVTALYSPSSGYFPLAPWAGLAVLCAYAALALGLAVVLLRRRDV